MPNDIDPDGVIDMAYLRAVRDRPEDFDDEDVTRAMRVAIKRLETAARSMEKAADKVLA